MLDVVAQFKDLRPRKEAYEMTKKETIGTYPLNSVVEGDCLQLAASLPANSIDVIVTSPPYWGQRTSLGTGVESDPREYVRSLSRIFTVLLEKLKPQGLLWINIGDAYNTPVNWRLDDRNYSTLGADKNGLSPDNSAYIVGKVPNGLVRLADVVGGRGDGQRDLKAR